MDERIKREIEDFRWLTAEGEMLTLRQMATSHIFNAMKMQYNHLAHVHGYKTVWFQHVYPDKLMMAEEYPNDLARTVVIFLYELYHRGDLPEKYHEPMQEIMNELKRWSGYQPVTIIIQEIEHRKGV